MTVLEDHSFRTRQAVSDLLHHVKPLLEMNLGTVAAASGLSIRATGEAFGRLRDDHFSFEEKTAALRGGLERLAMVRGAGFDLAVVVLLADLLQTRHRGGHLAEVWSEARLRLQGWPDTLRAAVANGLRRAVDLGLIDLEGPSDAACLTRGADAVAGPLLRVVRAMRPDELIEVAYAVGGDDLDGNLAALKEMIRQREAIFPVGDAALLQEAVGLMAETAGDPGFEGCTAILLLNAVAGGDADRGFARKWARLGEAYCGLRASARDPILAGIRWLYETDRAFLAEKDVAGLAIWVVDDLL